MRIILGSKNKDKRNILESALKELHLDVKIKAVEVNSEIPAQPLNKVRTRKGAVGRARNAKFAFPEADLWYGIEWELHNFGEGYHLVAFACLIDKTGKEFIGEGEEIHLPKEVSANVKDGEWFGEAIKEFAKKNKIDMNLKTRFFPFKHAIQNAYVEYLKRNGNLTYRKKVSGVITDNNGNFLIVQLLDYSKKDWTFPGGGIEEGESPKKAILRELKEELGTDKFVLIGRPKHQGEYDWPNFVIAKRLIKDGRTWKGQRLRFFLFRFNGKKKEIKPDPEEIRRFKWVKYEELKSHFNFPDQWEDVRKIIL